MTLLTRVQILDRLGEIQDMALRQSIHKLLTEHEAMRRRLEVINSGRTIKQNAAYIRKLNEQNSPGYAPKTGPHGAVYRGD